MIRIRAIFVNYIFVFILLFLTANSLIANWRLDPIWDLLYARVQSNFFNNVHASSMLSISVACFYLLAKARLKGISIIVICCFATASVHELTLAVIDTALARQLPQEVSMQYWFYLVLFLFLAIWKGNVWQRRVLAAQFFLLIGLYAFDIFHPVGSSIVGNSPTAFFYNPVTNMVEVLSWIVPVSLWFLPSRWVENWKLLPPRS